MGDDGVGKGPSSILGFKSSSIGAKTVGRGRRLNDGKDRRKQIGDFGGGGPTMAKTKGGNSDVGTYPTRNFTTLSGLEMPRIL